MWFVIYVCRIAINCSATRETSRKEYVPWENLNWRHSYFSLWKQVLGSHEDATEEIFEKIISSKWTWELPPDVHKFLNA